MKCPEAFIFFFKAARHQPQQEYNSGSDSICPSRRPRSTTTTKVVMDTQLLSFNQTNLSIKPLQTPPFRFAGVHNFNYPRSLSFAKVTAFEF
ncbi:hypothetical protein SLEP1_g58219 [Rubroshorea leprosula]|uniref:Uncharacterized protein n=1 Tax=Rubroshorea leprosula TaxID=152421 RepID=A0AAV5MNU8_9ROSI|nr:hypothetical protein SLEP1_g58219 [Rubroshorea leprosula]